MLAEISAISAPWLYLVLSRSPLPQEIKTSEEMLQTNRSTEEIRSICSSSSGALEKLLGENHEVLEVD